MKRKSFLSLILAVALLLSGCSITGGEISSMLTPPTMTSGREALSQAIKVAIGESYELVGPKEGSYRTGIISVDINGDEVTEAVCFYRPKASGGKLSFLVMENENEVWSLVAKGESDAASVGRVAFGDLDKDGLDEIIVGWQYLTNTDGSYEVYSLEKGEAVSRHTGLYSRFVVLEGEPERLVVISRNSATKTVTAALVGALNKQIGIINSVVMNDRTIDYLAITPGKAANGLPAVYVDELLENGQSLTEVLAINPEGHLTNELLTQQNAATLRYTAVTCRDSDQDGVYEIPLEQAMPAYTRNGVEENLYMIQWSSFDGKVLKPNGRSFVDITEKFYLDIPEEWYDRVKVERSEQSDRTFVFKTMEEEILFTIRVYGLSEYNNTTTGRMGWRKLYSNSDYVYTVYCEPENSMDIAYTRVYGLFNVIS